MRHTDDVSDKDIEKLLAEISAHTTGAAGSVNKPDTSAEVARGDSRGGRLPFALIAAAVMGGAGWLSGLLLPGLGSISAGVGAAFAAFFTALIAGPPRWFSR